MNSAVLTPALPRWRQFYALTKPRVVQLIVFCAVIGMALAVPGLPTAGEWRTIAAASAGIWLVAAAAAAFNCLIEQQIDARMKRTAPSRSANGTPRNVSRPPSRPSGAGSHSARSATPSS